MRRANIPPDLRSQFEPYGPDLLSQVVAAGEHSSKGEELNKLLQYNRPQMVEWIQEHKAKSHLLETHTVQHDLAMDSNRSHCWHSCRRCGHHRRLVHGVA
jgi:hypothetical protein